MVLDRVRRRRSKRSTKSGKACASKLYYGIINDASKLLILYLDVRKACPGGCVGTAASALSLSSFVADFVLFNGLLLNDLFEKKNDARRDGLCCACAPGTGVVGADPRRHAFSYDVSEDNDYL